MAELRLSVGTPEGPRSTVWKVVTARFDVYIISRMMGDSAKVSLHESGQGQLSLAAEWADAVGISPPQRHLDKWQVRQPTPNSAAHVFRLVFPSTELQTVGTPRKSRLVTWIEPPEPAECVLAELYLAPIPPQRVPSYAPLPLIAAIPWGDGGSLSVLRNRMSTDHPELGLLKRARPIVAKRVADRALRTGSPPRAALMGVFQDGTRAFIEIAPRPAAA